jgi:hypothetical protein
MHNSDVIVDENDLHDRELAELLNNIYLTLEKLELKAANIIANKRTYHK